MQLLWLSLALSSLSRGLLEELLLSLLERLWLSSLLERPWLSWWERPAIGRTT